MNPNHPHISRVDGGFPDDFLDSLGHGTAVMAAIQEKAPDAEYFAVRVFDRELRTNIDALIAAIQWSIDRQMDIVNLSLGTSKHAEKFEPLVSRVIVVSAAGMFPGDLPGVIRVAPDPDIARDRYRVEGETFFASGYPRSMPGVSRERNLSGVSFAVANMTGFVARACENLTDRSYQSVFEKLRSE
ncbi:MAG TPA: S8 family serine peptidase [Bryobacteraceae bacterium]|nr:S8 family serine peptidase [Bryobacteraceae bacterium]